MARRPPLLRAALVAGMAACIGMAAQPAAAAGLSIDVSGIPEAKGNIRVSLFTRDNWLDDGHQTANLVVPATSGNMTLAFPDLPSGIYAIALIHDADGNGDMTYSLLGLPTEGFGFSNNVAPVLSAPSFDSASFALGPDGLHLQVALRHL
jgi:uncharacterized protein (DUF2141 family)